MRFGSRGWEEGDSSCGSIHYTHDRRSPIPSPFFPFASRSGWNANRIAHKLGIKFEQHTRTDLDHTRKLLWSVNTDPMFVNAFDGEPSEQEDSPKSPSSLVEEGGTSLDQIGVQPPEEAQAEEGGLKAEEKGLKFEADDGQEGGAGRGEKGAGGREQGVQMQSVVAPSLLPRYEQSTATSRRHARRHQLIVTPHNFGAICDRFGVHCPPEEAKKIFEASCPHPSPSCMMLPGRSFTLS